MKNGKFLEMATEVSMLKFNHERLLAFWFGRESEDKETLFQHIRIQTVKTAASPAYQIDVLGRKAREDRVWLCECKYITSTG